MERTRIPPDAGPGLEPLTGSVFLTAPRSVAIGGDVAIDTPVGNLPLGGGYILYEFPDSLSLAGGFRYGVGDIFNINGHVNGFVQLGLRALI